MMKAVGSFSGFRVKARDEDNCRPEACAMIQLRDGLERLTLDIRELRETMLSRPVDPAPYLRQLGRTVEALEAKSEKVSSPKPPLDAEEVWATLASGQL